MGCGAESLRTWVRQDEIDRGESAGQTTAESETIRKLQREVRELRRANEILRKASVYFAQAEPLARPPTEVMVSFVDDNRDVFGVEACGGSVGVAVCDR
ncbi:hypothetical protein BH23ACT4_BH23ACT4_04270 [soil metagenome]